MTVSIFLAILITMFLLCGCIQDYRLNLEAEEAAVSAVIDCCAESFETEDLILFAQNINHDSTMLFFDTFGDIIRGWKALEGTVIGQYASLSEVDIAINERQIHIATSGDLAWAASTWTFKATLDEHYMELPVRGTWILKKRGGQWEIIHFHHSLTSDYGAINHVSARPGSTI